MMKNLPLISISIAQVALLIICPGSFAKGVSGGKSVGPGASVGAVAPGGARVGGPGQFSPGGRVNSGALGARHRGRLIYPGYYYGYSYVPPVWEPSLSEEFDHAGKTLTQSKSRGQIQNTEYAHLNQRLKDLQGKAKSLNNAAGGSMDEGDDQDIRRDIQQVRDEAQQK